MFTANQLNFLCRVQSSEDWHSSHFVKEVQKYHANPTDDWLGVVTIPQDEYEKLMIILAKASLEDIEHLQSALVELSQIDYRIFE